MRFNNMALELKKSAALRCTLLKMMSRRPFFNCEDDICLPLLAGIFFILSPLLILGAGSSGLWAKPEAELAPPVAEGLLQHDSDQPLMVWPFI